MRLLPVLLAMATAVATLPAGAQSTAQPVETSREIASGGLIILPDFALTIERQDVTLSRDSIRIVYAIANDSPEPRTLQVTFPLPDLDATVLADQTINLPKPDPVNFVGAVYAADGVERPAGFEQRALAFGLDVTADLTTAGIPLYPYLSATAERLARLPEALRTDLAERGVVRIDNGRIYPGWTLRTTAFWRQTFAPGKTTVLALTYQPIAGSTPASSAAIDTLREPYCLNAVAEAAIARRPSGPAQTGPAAIRLSWVHYALTSGSSWVPPVASFRLHVVKPTPDSLVATCRKGGRPAGPTVLEWKAEDFYPDDDVLVLFIR